MNRTRIFLAAIIAAVAIFTLRAEIIVPQRGGGGGGGSLTGTYTFNYPLTLSGATVSFGDQLTNKDFYALTEVFGTIAIRNTLTISTNLIVTNNVTVLGTESVTGGLVASGGILVNNGAAITLSSGSDIISIDPSTQTIGTTYDPLVFAANTNHILELSTNTSVFKSNVSVNGSFKIPNSSTGALAFIGAGGILTTAALSGASISGNTLTVTGGGGTTIQASTNSFDTNSNVVFGKGLLNSRNVFWDDFDGPDMKSVAFLQRRSPSGHTYRLTQGSGGIGTNGFLMTGGKWTQTNIVADATYLGVTNNTDKIWNRIGGVFRFKTNEPVAAPYSVEGILTSRIQDFATAAGDFLHSYVLVDSDTIVQRSLAESIIHTGSEDAGLYTRDRVYFEISFFTNCIVTEVNGVFRTAYTNDMTFAYLKCPIWEINGSVTNKIHVEWESIWAGYADPSLEQAVMENATDQAFNLIGATNAVLSLYSKRKFYQSTNANNIVNFTIPAPPSGYEVVLIHTNSAATNYTVTLFTNGVAASFYSVVDKTNATSWTVPTGAIVAQKFIFTGSTWIRTDVEEPLLTLAPGSGATFTTNGTTLTIAAVAGAAGSTTQVQFNEAGVLAGTNEFDFIRGTASSAATVRLSNSFPAAAILDINGGSVVRRDTGAPGLSLGASALTNWSINPIGHLIPTLGGTYDIGTNGTPIRTLYANSIVIPGGFAGSRYTNYPTGGLTIDCSTAVTANITNAVASSYSVLLTNAVIGTSGSLGLVSDGTARTITIAAGPAITWMSTNDAPAGAIITTVSKRSLFCWRVGMGTDGLSTNIHCWVKNQTP